MNICFFGVGGVGGYYGTLAAKHVNETGLGKTYFIARGKHKDAIQQNGLLLKKTEEKKNFWSDLISVQIKSMIYRFLTLLSYRLKVMILTAPPKK